MQVNINQRGISILLLQIERISGHKTRRLPGGG